MAVPIITCSTSDSHFFLSPFSLPHSPITDSVSKKMSLVSCAPAESHPVRSELSFCVGTHLIPHPKNVLRACQLLVLVLLYMLYLEFLHNPCCPFALDMKLVHLTPQVHHSHVSTSLKVEKGREDAFFVSSYNGGVIAVADGVSGWAEQHVDPSLFSRELMTNASCLVEDDEVNYDPQILVRKAHAATSSKGSATVIVSMLERNGILKIANVGDCGLRVIRKGQIIFSTFPQEHYFDCPYQLSSEVVSQTYLDATVSSVELTEGDIIGMGSDGLFDNVFDHEIVSTVAKLNDVVEAGIG